MRKSVIIILILLLAVCGLFGAQTYSIAMVEFPITVKNPRGLINLDAVDSLTIEQGKSEQALTITNNLLVYLEYELLYSHDKLTIVPGSGSSFIAPGEVSGVILEVSDNCPPGVYDLNIELLAKFDGGEASIKTTISVNVLEISSELTSKAKPDQEAEPEKQAPIVPAAAEYTMTLTIVGSGTVNLDPGEHQFTEGEVVELIAAPAENWLFEKWLIGDQINTNLEIAINIDDDLKITATFRKVEAEESESATEPGPESEPEPESGPEPEPEPELELEKPPAHKPEPEEGNGNEDIA